MAKAIILYNYNKYYNRIIRRLDTFAEYNALIVSPDEGITPPQYRGLLRENFNFDFADGVHASKVLEIKKNEDIFFRTEHPDYMIVEEDYNAGTVEEPVITKKLTRWYILDLVRLRGLKYQLSLRRDLLADFYNEVLHANCFIERGNPTNIEDPIIFNKEGFTFNQIKKKELILSNNKYSGNGGGWIVGYLAKQESPVNVSITGKAPTPSDVPNKTDLPQYVQDIINSSDSYCYAYNPNGYILNFNFRGEYSSNIGTLYGTWSVYCKDEYEGERSFYYSNLLAGNTNNAYPYFKKIGTLAWYNEDISARFKNAWIRTLNRDWLGKIMDWFQADIVANSNKKHITYEQYDACKEVIYKDGTHYYKLTFKDDYDWDYPLKRYTKAQVDAGSDAIALNFKTMFNDYLIDDIRVFKNNDAVANQNVCYATVYRRRIYKQIEMLDFDTVSTTISGSRNQLIDAPYDMFAIPYGAVEVRQNNSKLFDTVGNVSLAIARGIALKNDYVYDIQLLPYCPFEQLTNDGKIDITGLISGTDYNLITKTIDGQTINVSIVLYLKTSKGTFDFTIDSDSNVYNECLEETESVENKKVRYETELVRFVSPNFSSVFEINVQKNKGITSLNVDYFYKPYSPYLHIAPYFSGLYGEDFNDPKGLICSGDFSIATVSSQWETYQIQNKNYELIFNRQIENLDVNNSIAYQQMETTGKLGVATSVIQGASSGAVAGGMTGNPYVAAAGAVAGGVAGGITSGIGAKKDLEYLSATQQEARSYMKDMFTYQLGNIKALPYSLTKVSAFTENNKIFPFIEFYDCTEEEKQALRNKLFFNGMTIMRIGTIGEFINGDHTYVQGQLIRLLGLDEDNHVVSEIAKEIKMGAYYYGTNSISS